MFSLYFMLFATLFLEGGGGGQNLNLVTTAVLKPDHITGYPVVTSMHASLLCHADISS